MAEPVEKVNVTLDGIILREEGRNISPTIYINDMYKKYQDCGDLEETLMAACDFMERAYEQAPVVDVDSIMKDANEKIVFQLINTEQNKTFLEQVPHREFQDLSIVYKVIISADKDAVQSSKITNEFAKRLGMSEEQLFKCAAENTRRLFPPVVRSMNDIMREMFARDGMPQEMQALGRASAQEVLTAQKALQQANSSAQQAENGALQLKQNILMLLGFDADAPVTFADVPVPDATRLAAMDLAADTQAAVSANYDLMSVRAAKAEGSSNRTVKKRNVAYTEDSVTITVQNLYAAVVSKKQAYDSATAGYQAAAQSYEAAKRQNALGMLSRANYLGLECSWLSSVASYKSAELEYTKAVENYEWAVKGLIVTN